MKTYQYSETKWIAANSKFQADAYAEEHNWDPHGGLIFDEVHTAKLLSQGGSYGGIDAILSTEY